MIEAIPEKPGWLTIVCAKGRRHLVSVFSMGRPQRTGDSTTFIPFTEYENLFVRSSVDEVKAAAKRARTLRKAQAATAQRAQLGFDFGQETATVQLPTNTAAELAPSTEEEVANV